MTMEVVTSRYYKPIDLFHKKATNETEHSFTMIDLFAGIGGFRMGAEREGGACLFSSEWDEYAQKTYFANYGEVPYGDITLEATKQHIPEHFDLLTAGFPCQPFSISGKKKGFEDTRGTLIYEVFEIISRHRPRVVMLENVKHLLHHDKGNTFRVIIDSLSDLGYNVTWAVLNATNFGVPQNRERIIIVGTRDEFKPFSFARLTQKRSDLPSLIDFLDKEGDFEYLNEGYTLIDDPKSQVSGLIFAGYLNKKIRTNGVREGTMHLSRVHKQPNRIYDVKGVHPTLPSQESSGRFWIHNEGVVRKLTISECYRIMGFPDDFKRIVPLSEQYRQIGNSVCVPMVQSIIHEMKSQGLL